jgi:signal transduction histidine kinase
MDARTQSPRRRYGRIFSDSFVALLCLVFVLSYLIPYAEASLFHHPQTVWPIWLNHALLVCLLVWQSKTRWPFLIAAALAGIVLFDVHAGVPLHSLAWFIPADVVQVSIAAFAFSFLFKGVLRLTSARVGAFLIVAALATIAGACISAPGIQTGDYWKSWLVSFFADFLGFLTVPPAIFSLLRVRSAWSKKPLGRYVELSALMSGLGVASYVAFVALGGNNPALLYALVPFLLWAVLRFGSLGVTGAMIAVVFTSIYGAIHNKGPFIGLTSLENVLALQVFLFFTAIPFLVLAAVVEERNETQRELRAGADRFQLATRAGRMFAYEWDAPTDRASLPGSSAQVLELEDGCLLDGQDLLTLLTVVHPEDKQRIAAARNQLTPENPQIQIAYRVVRPDGSMIWVERVGRGYFDEKGRLLRIVGMVVDITRRKASEAALANVNRLLLQAQEQECSRIARELHDDICQQLALLTLKLSHLTSSVQDSPALNSELADLHAQASSIGSDVQSLSHELHSPRLEYLGLAPAMVGLCSEMGKRHGVEVRFASLNVPASLPRDVSLCLFRVLQEALHNALKHSGVRQYEVRLWRSAGEIRLAVADSGIGFDLGKANSLGLGLISMEERLKLVNGRLSITSRLNRGTRIEAFVPFTEEVRAMRAAG